MSVTTYACVIENGQVRLPAGVVLADRQTVFVVVPDSESPAVRKLPGVRLANPDDAAKFEMAVAWEETA